jgi:hypothetical protein
MAKKTATTEQPADTREQGMPASETPEQQAIKQEAQRLADQTRGLIKGYGDSAPLMYYLAAMASTARAAPMRVKSSAPLCRTP